MSDIAKKAPVQGNGNMGNANIEEGETSIASEDLANLNAARDATKLEHSRPILRTAKLYQHALMFSAFISLAIVMEGYDMHLMSNFYSLPQFRKKYGHQMANGDYQLTVAWQSLLTTGSWMGEIIGLTITGFIVEWLGFRKCMGIGLAGTTSAIFLPFFSRDDLMLFFGEFICGIPWGMFQGMASTYAADVAPTALRPLLTTYINLCWGIGQFIAVGVLKGCLGLNSEWAFRIPFATQWVWIPPIAVAVLLAPESPWWLIRKDRVEDARRALRRLACKEVSDHEVDNNLHLMILTNRHEAELQEGDGTRYQDLFKGTNLRRTEISAFAWICQVTCGAFFSSNVTYFMQQAGLGNEDSFNIGLAMTGLNILGTVCSWFVMARVGRRTLYIYGLVLMILTGAIVGFVAIPGMTPASAWATGGLMIINNFVFFVTLGPVCYTVVAEMPTVRLRSKSIAVSRSAYLIAGIGGNFLNPAMINPTGWDLRGLAGFVWAGLAFISLVWVFFRLPETKDRTVAEIDKLFEDKVPTRRFAKAKVCLFENENCKI